MSINFDEKVESYELVDRFRGISFSFHLMKRICSSFYKCTILNENGELIFKYFVKLRQRIDLCKPLKIHHENITVIKFFDCEEKNEEKKEDISFVIYEDDFGFETNFRTLYDEKKFLGEQKLRFIVEEVIQTLEVIHQHGEVHGNITMEAILIGRKFSRIKIDSDLVNVDLKNRQVDDIINFGKILKKYVALVTKKNVKYSDQLLEIIQSLCEGNKEVFSETKLLKDDIIQIIESFYSSILKHKNVFQKYNVLETKEQMKYLEELCIKFHKLSFVKGTIKKLQEIYKEEIKKFLISTSEKELLQKSNFLRNGRIKKLEKFIQDTIESEKFRNFQEQLNYRVKITIDKIIHINSASIHFTPNSPKSSITSSSDWERLFAFDPTNPIGGMTSPEIIKTICSRLSIKNSLPVRLSSVEELLRMNISDILCSEHWNFLLKQISKCMGDPNDRIVECIFQIHLDLFKFSPPEQGVQIFHSLLDHLIWNFESNSTQSFANFEKKNKIFWKTIKKMSMFKFFLKELSNYWLNFGESLFKKMINKIFYLLSQKFAEREGLNFTKEAIILDNPFIYLCLIDVKGKWAIRFLNESYLRQSLLKSQSKFFLKLVDTINNHSTNVRDYENEELNFDIVKVYYYYLVNSISIVGKLFLYKDSISLLFGFDDNLIHKTFVNIILHFRNFLNLESIFYVKDKKTYSYFLKSFCFMFENLINLNAYFVKEDFIFLLIEDLWLEKNVKNSPIDCRVKFECINIILRILIQIEVKTIINKKKLVHTMFGLFKVVIHRKNEYLNDKVFRKVLKNMLILVSLLFRNYSTCRYLINLLRNEGYESSHFSNELKKKEEGKNFDFITLIFKKFGNSDDGEWKSYVVESMYSMFINFDSFCYFYFHQHNEKFLRYLINNYQKGVGYYWFSQVVCLFDKIVCQFSDKVLLDYLNRWREATVFSYSWTPKGKGNHRQICYNDQMKNLFFILSLSDSFYNNNENSVIDFIVKRMILNDDDEISVSRIDDKFYGGYFRKRERSLKYGIKLLLPNLLDLKILQILLNYYQIDERTEIGDGYLTECRYFQSKMLSRIKTIRAKVPLVFRKIFRGEKDRNDNDLKKIEIKDNEDSEDEKERNVSKKSDEEEEIVLFKNWKFNIFSILNEKVPKKSVMKFLLSESRSRKISKVETSFFQRFKKDNFKRKSTTKNFYGMTSLTMRNGKEVVIRDSFFYGFLLSIFDEDFAKLVKFLKYYIYLPESCYVWNRRGEALELSSNQKFNPLLLIFNLVEKILRNEYPNVYSFFYLQGFSPFLIVKKWVSQFFLNYLKYQEIIKIFLLIWNKGIDCMVYVIVSGLIHIKENREIEVMKELCQLGNWKKLMEPMEDYRLKTYTFVIMNLQKKYKIACMNKLMFQ